MNRTPFLFTCFAIMVCGAAIAMDAIPASPLPAIEPSIPTPLNNVASASPTATKKEATSPLTEPPQPASKTEPLVAPVELGDPILIVLNMGIPEEDRSPLQRWLQDYELKPNSLKTFVLGKAGVLRPMNDPKRFDPSGAFEPRDVLDALLMARQEARKSRSRLTIIVWKSPEDLHDWKTRIDEQAAKLASDSTEPQTLIWLGGEDSSQKDGLGKLFTTVFALPYLGEDDIEKEIEKTLARP